MVQRVDIAKEIDEDHKRIMDEFLSIGDSLVAKDRAEKILGKVKALICSHLRFEEEALYPSLRKFLGEEEMSQLIQEHDEVIIAIRNLAEVLSNEELSWEERVENSWWQIRSVLYHAKNCDLSVASVKSLDDEEMDQLESKLLNSRNTKVHLFEWAEWRRSRATYVPYLDTQ